MTDEVSRLVLAVDSNQVGSATSELNKFASAGKGAEASAEALAKATAKTESAQARLAQAVLKAKSAQDALDKVSQTAGVSQDKLAAAQARSASASATLAIAQQTANKAQKDAVAAAQAHEKALASTGKQAKLTAFQQQQLGFQLHDFFVQVASGQSPLTAFVQQGSQLSGTFGGAGAALRAVASTLTPLRVVLAGAAVGIGVLAYGFIEGSARSLEFRRSLILTGNTAAQTLSQFNAMALGVSSSTNTTIGSTKELQQGLISSGRFSQESLQRATEAGQLLAKVTGASTEDILKSFTAGADGVTNFATQLNRQFNFLSGSQFEYIKRTEEQGDRTKALAFTFDLLLPKLRAAAAESNTTGNAFAFLKNNISKAIDVLKSIGEDTDPAARLKVINDQIQARSQSLGRPVSSDDGGYSAILIKEKDAIEGVIAAQRERAKQDADDAAKRESQIDFAKLKEQYLTREQQLAKEIAEAKAKAAAAGTSQKDLSQVLAGIREKFYGGLDRELKKAALESDLSAIKSLLDAQTGAYKNAESILEASRQANLVEDAKYFAEKRHLLEANADAEVAALSAESARLQVENIRLGRKTESQTEVLANQRTIAENEAKIQRIRADAAAGNTVLDIQQADALKRVKQAYVEAGEASKSYIQSLSLQGGRELQGIGIGEQERRRLDGLNQIDDRFRQERENLDREFRSGSLQTNKEAYQAQIAQLETFRTEALNIYNGYFDQVLKKQREVQAGITEALRNYSDDAKKTGEIARGIVENAFKGLEDTLTETLNTGKFSGGNFLRSILGDLNRGFVRTQITGPLAELLNGQVKRGEGAGGFLSDILGSVLGTGGQTSALSSASAAAAMTALTSSAAGSSVALTANTAALTTLTSAASAAAAELSHVAVSGGGGGGIPLGFGNFLGSSTPSASSDPLGDFIATLPSYDVGTPYVPKDMLAKIHKGERILTAAENSNYGSGGSNVTVQVINNGSGSKVSTQEQQAPNGDRLIKVIIDEVTGAISRDVSAGRGQFTQALQSTYGLNRAAGALR